MKTIYKYPLKVEGYQEVEMPVGAQILCVQTQNETPCLWAKVNTEIGNRAKRIVTIGTGHPITDNPLYDLEYIGTYQKLAGVLVFHVYEAVDHES